MKNKIINGDCLEVMKDIPCGLIDAIIWVVAKKLNAKLVTCDFHFRAFKNVVLLK